MCAHKTIIILLYITLIYIITGASDSTTTPTATVPAVGTTAPVPPVPVPPVATSPVPPAPVPPAPPVVSLPANKDEATTVMSNNNTLIDTPNRRTTRTQRTPRAHTPARTRTAAAAVEEIANADEPNASDLDDTIDVMTDDGEEQESDHEDEEYQWRQPNNFDRQSRDDPVMSELGNLKWTAPRCRASIPSANTGPDQHAQFEPKVEDGYFANLFFDALPIFLFWTQVVTKFSRLYWSQSSSATSPSRGRNSGVSKLFNPANFIRMIAVVIMRGMVRCPDEPTFFHETTFGPFSRSGAEQVSGLTLNQYQQLMRYLHLCDNQGRGSVEDDDWDKLYHLRPLIDLLQAAFHRWCIPGKNNAFDEAGIPSKFRWLRQYNPDKPHSYFIEILMACCSVTKYCWAFFINEKTDKSVVRRNRSLPPGVTRGRGQRQKYYVKVPHFQHEFDDRTRELQRKIGPTTAHIYHFAKILRVYDSEPDKPVGSKTITYRLFMDRRWDSLYGHYEAMSKFQVSCTSTVMKGSRFHIAHDDNFTTLKGDTKKLNKRGKYRSAYAKTSDGLIMFRTVVWADSKLVSVVSCDLGTEEDTCERRVGRHIKKISCPRVLVVREKCFRAVDQNDQMRLGKWHIDITPRKKV